MSRNENISEIVKNSKGYSVHIVCPNCHKEIDTEVEEVYRCCAWFAFCVCFIFAFVPMRCQLKPGCVDVRHQCPNCGKVLGKCGI